MSNTPDEEYQRLTDKVIVLQEEVKALKRAEKKQATAMARLRAYLVLMVLLLVLSIAGAFWVNSDLVHAHQQLKEQNEAFKKEKLTGKTSSSSSEQNLSADQQALPLPQQVFLLVAHHLNVPLKEIHIDSDLRSDLDASIEQYFGLLHGCEEQFAISIGAREAEEIRTVGNLIETISDKRAD